MTPVTECGLQTRSQATWPDIWLLPAPQEGGAGQSPIDVAAVYKCCAIHASIDARAGDAAAIGPLVAASGVCEGAGACSGTPL